MFLGEYEYKIDAKGRVPIPPKFRARFGEGLVLGRGPDRCIIACPPTLWDEITERFSALPFTRSKERRIGRFIFGTAFSLELDEQGRVLLPAKLREYAGIKETAVVVGANKYLEIWDKELWEEEQEDVGDQAWQILEGMERRE